MHTHTLRVAWDVTLAPSTVEAMEAIPGVRLRRDHSSATISWHAVHPFHQLLQRASLAAKVWDAEKIPDPKGSLEWETVQRRLLRGAEVRDAYLHDWPTNYQRESLCFTATRPGALLHHPTGSGKTFTAICWGLLEAGPLLIVTRASTRVQFCREVERFTHLRAFPCKPANEVRKKDQWQTMDDYFAWCAEVDQRPVVVCGWESLPTWADDLLGASFTSVVWDESQKGKSHKRWERIILPDPASDDYASAVRAVQQRKGIIRPDKTDPEQMVGLIPRPNVANTAAEIARSVERRLATTATPIPDRVRDLWGQMDLLEPWAWGNYRTFAFRYCDAKPGLYGGLDDKGVSNIDELSRRLDYVIHHVPANVARAELPAKRRQTWYIPPSEQVQPTGGWKRAVKAASKQGAGALLELRLAMAASSKRRAILGRIGEHMESGHKVVVFTARRRDCEELADALRSMRGKAAPLHVWCGHGGDSQEARLKMLDDYQQCEAKGVLVGTGEAWGTGIDGLQCTDAAIFALLPWTPGNLTQWEGRFTRLGQDRPVTIYFPIAEGTADEHLASILLDKLPAVDKLAHDESLEGAAEALAGIEEDEDAFAESVLDCIRKAMED